ncbi:MULTISPECIES: hypothetical protein [unclassified Bosea (in: a-proteobacteria)]|uniref:hypothetical protein n=1 Tax=unclassified Bosea (in: a-proteobacteria) TaxID=2653178 RepID=UPI000F74C735|nr:MULTISPECIES: hypothetical protein [unclassified Bosea (in: a-proteobacteria)]AZO79624.1 hypothetical protein BLM15_19960 [Bosea sp. Tri-49]RXT16131.1 hypothetical protein B5U98_29435 [Bosea sp. Tri-39]RXT39823.1 hypothetical protein B5U99_06480 [Bosea sp. Tri-54]
MSTGLERRLAKVEAKHHAERGLDRRIQRMTDAELDEAIRTCNSQLESEIGPNWRAWLAENEPKTEVLFRQLESEGVEL